MEYEEDEDLVLCEEEDDFQVDDDEVLEKDDDEEDLDNEEVVYDDGDEEEGDGNDDDDVFDIDDTNNEDDEDFEPSSYQNIRSMKKRGTGSQAVSCLFKQKKVAPRSFEGCVPLVPDSYSSESSFVC